ncbi:MAG TPA: ArsA family ATPase [Polyangiaceae bacterium]|nr:ArsA family ATPase [Polyangiaceae bacterium]
MPHYRVRQLEFDCGPAAGQNRGLSMPAFAPRRFLFITGKGGVGKTTVTAALARSLSARGLRVLVTVCGAKERLSTLLGAVPLGSEISQLAPNIWGVQLVSEVALREYGMMKLKNRVLVDAIFDSKYVAGFLNGTPGMKEWSLLGKAWFHSTEEEQGRPRFDVVLFDAPATGHGLDMLRVPKVIVELAPPGVLRSDAERAWEMFRDPARSGVVVVTLPEEMPTNESLELCAALKDELTLPICEIVVNSLLPPLFSSTEASALERLTILDQSAPERAVLSSGVRRAARERIQDESLRRLSVLGVPLRKVELLVDGASTPDAVARISRNFDA